MEPLLLSRLFHSELLSEAHTDTDLHCSMHVRILLIHNGTGSHCSLILLPEDSSGSPGCSDSPFHPVIHDFHHYRYLAKKLLFYPGYYFLSFSVIIGYPAPVLLFHLPDDTSDGSTDLQHEPPVFRTGSHL